MMMDQPVYVELKSQVAHEGNRRPYYVDVGRAQIVGAGNNSVLIKYGVYGKLYLCGTTGEVYDVTKIGHSRYDLIEGKVVECGTVVYTANSRDKNHVAFVEADHSGNVQRCDMNAVKRLIGRQSIPDLYAYYRIGFVNGALVFADGNTALVMSKDGNIKRLRFRSGLVYVYNGYVIHEREEWLYGNYMVAAYDDNGQRVGVNALIIRDGLQRRALCVVTRRILRLMQRIPNMPMENVRVIG